jgi:HEPN domain-containing protein
MMSGSPRKGGGGTVNRAELQRLANERIADAKALLAARRWSAAYYLAGYAVECGLKACVLAFVERTGVIFEDRKYAEKCWTHDLRVYPGSIREPRRGGGR